MENKEDKTKQNNNQQNRNGKLCKTKTCQNKQNLTVIMVIVPIVLMSACIQAQPVNEHGTNVYTVQNQWCACAHCTTQTRPKIQQNTE